MIAKQTRREKSRLIESADRRIVHFIFNPSQPDEDKGGCPVKQSPFTRKFVQLLEGPEVLEAFEKQEAEKFEEYVTAIQQEDENPINPIVYPKNDFYEIELKSLHRLAFAVADNPFLKTDTAKYYPEIHVVQADGEVVTSISPK